MVMCAGPVHRLAKQCPGTVRTLSLVLTVACWPTKSKYIQNRGSISHSIIIGCDYTDARRMVLGLRIPKHSKNGQTTRIVWISETLRLVRFSGEHFATI